MRKKLIAGAVILNLAIIGGGAALYLKNKRDTEARFKAKEAKIEMMAKQREAKVETIIKRLEGCKDKRLLDKGCFGKKKRKALEHSAKAYEEMEDYEKAGLNYVKLGNLRDAKRMIKQCEKAGNVSGAEAIREAMRIRAEAFERFSSQPSEDTTDKK